MTGSATNIISQGFWFSGLALVECVCVCVLILVCGIKYFYDSIASQLSATIDVLAKQLSTQRTVAASNGNKGGSGLSTAPICDFLGTD